MSKGEDTLAAQIDLRNRAVPRPPFQILYERQYHFHSERAWRADFAVWGDQIAGEPIGTPLLVEVDGAKRGKPGAHQRVDGIDRDCRRAAEAMLLGYRMLRVSSGMVRDGTALTYIEKLLEQNNG